ncbi:unnamed protein product, partial [Rotaria sp. Silwood1]
IICNLVINFISGQSANNNRSIISKACACYNQGICDPVTSSCICPSGFLGQQCERLECTIHKNCYFLNLYQFCIL